MFNLTNEKDKYLLVCEKSKGLSKLTLKAYRIDLRQFCEFMNGLDALSKQNLIKYIDGLHQEYKPKSAKRKIACVKAFYRYMEIEDIIAINPFHKIRLQYKEAFVLPKTIPTGYIKILLKHAYDCVLSSKTKYQLTCTLRNVITIEMLFSTGMRVSEVSNLTRENLDLQDGTIRIFGKGSKERVSCLLNNDLQKLIKAYYSLTPESKFVLQNRSGERYSEQSIRNMINRYCNEANIPIHITPHMFRHTFATSLLDENVDIRHIQKLLGHSSITTTQIYTYISTSVIKNILKTKHPRLKFDNTYAEACIEYLTE